MHTHLWTIFCFDIPSTTYSSPLLPFLHRSVPPRMPMTWLTGTFMNWWKWTPSRGSGDPNCIMSSWGRWVERSTCARHGCHILLFLYQFYFEIKYESLRKRFSLFLKSWFFVSFLLWYEWDICGCLISVLPVTISKKGRFHEIRLFIGNAVSKEHPWSNSVWEIERERISAK